MKQQPYYEDEHVTLYHGDCGDILPHLPQVDLVLTDPPYGIGEAAGKNKSRGKLAVSKDYGNDSWDDKPVQQPVIDSLITQPAVIFGGNYYAMPPSSCWLVWNKQNGKTDFADCELAWTNLPGAVRKIDYLWHGCMKKKPEERHHPTQKPLDVMKWCILQADTKLKKQVQTILDPFAGSGTTLRAAKDMNRRCIGIEQSKKYCDVIVKRMKQQVLAF